MYLTRRNFSRQIMSAGMAALWANRSVAQVHYPNKAIHMVVPFQAGGLTDRLARIYAGVMSEALNQAVVVDNKVGAGGLIAARTVAKAAPDGYTVLFALSSSLWQSRVIQRDLQFDPDRDLVPLAISPIGALVVGVSSTSDNHNFKELVERSKTRPASVGCVGVGSAMHIMIAFINRHYGAKITPIFYKGEAPMWTDLAGGQIDAAAGSLQAFEPLYMSGKIRPAGFYGVPSISRLQNVQSLEAQGFSDSLFRLQARYIICVPARTPDRVISLLSSAVRRAAESQAARELNQLSGAEGSSYYGQEAAQSRWRLEMPIWVDAVKKSDIVLD